MTRIALCSDQHFDLSSRWEECLRITDWIAEDIARRDVDVVALGGDLFERRPLPDETKAAAEWVIHLADIAPVVGVQGNHDVPNAVAVMNLLESRHPISFHERPTVQVIAGCAFACVPWPTTGALLSQMPEASKEGADQVAVEMLRSILRGLGSKMDNGEVAEDAVPRILLAHAMVSGAKTSAGQPLIGLALSVGIQDLALARADAYLLGHIHCPNDWTVNGAPIIYPGSPRRTAYGETEDKGYVIVEFEGRKLVGWERIKTPATPMLLLESTWTADGFASPWIDEEPDFQGAEVRFRYACAADRREAAKAAAKITEQEMRTAGAVAVKIEEEITPTVRARAPEITAARTLPEKLDALWRLQGFELGERRATLFSKVAQLEGELNAA